MKLNLDKPLYINETSGGKMDLKTNRNTPQAGDIDLSWKSLYRVAAVAALVLVVFTVIQSIVFVTNPPPSDVQGWFTLFQHNKLIGLLDMDLLLVADNLLAVPIFLALYFILKKSAKSTMLLALVLGLAGVVTYFASNTAFQMLSLSSQYASATTDAQRSMILAGGQSMLAIYEGTAFYVGNFIGTVALLMVSIIMLRNNVFSKTTAYTGIFANVLGFALFIPNTIGITLSVVSVLFLAIWWVMIARKLFQIGRLAVNPSSAINAGAGA
jgi:hypothetical protein